MVTQAELEAAIHAKVGDISTLYVSDVSGGCGQAYDVVLVSDQFEGLPTLKRHRLVNERLKDEIAAMHAFSQKTYTTKQFSELRSKYADQTPSAVPTQAAGVAVPELTLTPDTESGRLLSAAQSANASPANVPIGTSRVSSPTNTGISRLHYTRISSVEFWLALRKELEEQFLHADTMDLDSPTGTASPRSQRRPPGEAEVERLFEDFFLSQKHHLTANDVARIRDATGMLGMAGA
ncbi:uncharacterized protein MJAP1_003581 [Malassezia japonica]|uniref:Bola-like protein n=1 Tax=Malassezia japonica TaxID=223818 RepID=A0AAF0F0N1_9BASI|nr:uncharacterized protein MJAP1_003581 [Malassezia japonica]WFD40593.1 hypothetical protein MJAP1_003581 [Malassezia japonica]